jgi:osmotically-inducible protein OsmY
VTTTQRGVVLTGFVSNREPEERLAAEIREIRGFKSVKSLSKKGKKQ